GPARRAPGGAASVQAAALGAGWPPEAPARPGRRGAAEARGAAAARSAAAGPRGGAALAQAMRRLEGMLAEMARPDRRAALEQLPAPVKAALVGHMTVQRATAKPPVVAAAGRVGDVVAVRGAACLALRGEHGSCAEPAVLRGGVREQAAKRPRSEGAAPRPASRKLPSRPEEAPSCRHSGAPLQGSGGPHVMRSAPGVRGGRAARRAEHHRFRDGVRSVRSGVFQATICFEHLLLRSCTTKSRAVAQQLYAVLARVQEFACASGSSAERAASAASGAKAGALPRDQISQRLRHALSGALGEAGVQAEVLRPSFATYVSSGTWAGKIESPTTPCVEQALLWRERLLVARGRGWPDLREAWIQV
ncbi:unnamed protein product, partial [Prorocentrum cordatum]